MLTTALLSPRGRECVKPLMIPMQPLERNFGHHTEKYAWLKENKSIPPFPVYGLETSKSLQENQLSSFTQNSHCPALTFFISDPHSSVWIFYLLETPWCLLFFPLWPAISKLLFYSSFISGFPLLPRSETSSQNLQLSCSFYQVVDQPHPPVIHHPQNLSTLDQFV